MGSLGMELQTALVRIATTPAAALSLIDSRDVKASGLGLSFANEQRLIHFLEKYNRQFKIYVLLIKKKRWNGIRSYFVIIPRLYLGYELECLWEDYVARLTFDTPAEAGSLKESVQFGNYLLSHAAWSDAHRELVRYELCRNETIIEWISNSAVYPVECLPVLDLDAYPQDQTEVFVHPCMRIESFTVNVTQLVRDFSSGGNRDTVLAGMEKTIETLVYFKRCNKAGIGVLKVSSALAGVLRYLHPGQMLGTVRAATSNEISAYAEHIDTILQKLCKAGVLMFRSMENARS